METKIDSSPEYVPNPDGSPPYSSVPVAEGVYMPHESIEEQIIDFVMGNIEVSRGHQHMREVLDDIILDLSNFRNALATPEQYQKKNLI